MKNWFKKHKLWHRTSQNKKTFDIEYEFPKFHIKPIFKWFDLWIGVYIDQENRIIYVFPVPMFGFKIGYQYRKV